RPLVPSVKPLASPHPRMYLRLVKRLLLETDKRLVWKLLVNMGWRGVRSVQKHKRRIRRGEYFPPFLYVSIINSCNLRCQGCWVKVDGPRHMIDAATMRRVIGDAKRRGNSYSGILGGEPFMHPELLQILGEDPVCNFRIVRN